MYDKTVGMAGRNRVWNAVLRLIRVGLGPSATVLAALLLLLGLVGCGGDDARNAPDVISSSRDGNDTTQEVADADPTEEEDAAPVVVDQKDEDGATPGTVEQVSVRVIDQNELKDVIEGYRGKVVFIDFWATWCIACIELFPHTVELHERFADQGLAVISVSFDEPDSEAVVLDFLQKQGATFDNFISQYGASVESVENFGLPGMLPHLMLYDRSGNLAHTFPEPQSPVDPEAVDQAIEQLLQATE